MNSFFLNLVIVASCVAVLLSGKSVSAFSFQEMYNRILSAASGVAPQVPLAHTAFAVATTVRKQIYHQQFEKTHQRVSFSEAPKRDPTVSSGMYLKYSAFPFGNTCKSGGGGNPYYGESVLMDTCMIYNATSSVVATLTTPELAVFQIFGSGDTTCTGTPVDYYQVPIACNIDTPYNGSYRTAVSANHGWGENTGYGVVAYDGATSCSSKSGTITGSAFYGTDANGCVYEGSGYSQAVACHDGGIFLLQFPKQGCTGKATVEGVYSKVDLCGQAGDIGMAYGNPYLKCYNLQTPTTTDKADSKNKNLRPKA